LEYKAARLAASAMRIVRLVNLGAPQLILENEHNVLKERVDQFFDGKLPLMSIDEMHNIINRTDYKIIEGVLKTYAWESILEMKEKIEKGPNRYD
jgi:DNA-directed RNA polymerase beta' subunit